MTNAEKKGLAVMAAGLAFTNAATAGRLRWVVTIYWAVVTVYWFIVYRSLK